jgi:GNAT superfamily N-acetyltransferase
MTPTTEPIASDHAAIARCHRNVVEGTWATIRLGPRPRRAEWPGAVALANGLPSPLTNTLFVTAAGTDPGPVLEAARAFFGRSVPWKVVATPETLRGIGRAAESRALQPGEPAPGLLLDPIPSAPPPPTGLEIQEVAREADLRAFRHAAGLGFRIPRWILRVAVPRIPRAGTREEGTLRYFVGRAAGRAVASSALFSHDGISGISFVATVPTARRRGYGAAMTWAALEAGRVSGDRAAYLQATEMGRPVYEAMGFRWASDYPEWVARVSGPRLLPAIARTLWFGATVWS